MFGRDKPPRKEPFITGNFNLTATLGSSGRTMQMAGYLYYEEDQESIERRIAIMRSIMEKEQTLAEIPELEAKREQQIKGLGQAREVLNDLLEKQKNGPLTSQEKMNVKNWQVNIEKMSKEIDKGTEAIAEARKKAGVG
jgi:hypothetical protein